MVAKKKHKIGDKILTSVLRWTVGKTSGKGTKYVKVTLSGGIDWTGWLTPKAMDNTMKHLATMGFKGSKISDLQYDKALNTDLDLSAEIGSTREYKGNTYYEAKWVNSIRDLGFDDKAKGILDEFDIDTRAYIDDAQDMAPPASSEGLLDQDFDLETDATFTADDIPF